MNQKHEKFILKTLIPYILREQGRGFGMSLWTVRKSPWLVVRGSERS